MSKILRFHSNIVSLERNSMKSHMAKAKFIVSPQTNSSFILPHFDDTSLFFRPYKLNFLKIFDFLSLSYLQYSVFFKSSSPVDSFISHCIPGFSAMSLMLSKHLLLMNNFGRYLE